MGDFSMKKEQATQSSSHRPTRSSETCAACAQRFRLRRFPGFRCTLPSGARVIRRATPVHDSYISAPYILTKLKASQGLAQGMSYWTYTDLFRRTRTSDGAVSRRIRPAEPARHSQAGVLRLQVPSRASGRKPQDERSAGNAGHARMETSRLSSGTSSSRSRR